MRLVLATTNPGKLVELERLLAPFDVDLVSAGVLGLEPPPETGSSYVENATIKAVAAALATGSWALGDDTGLAIDVLDGAPGIDTARYTAEHGGVARACADLAARTGLVADGGTIVRAALHCALVLANPDGAIEIADAVVSGRLRWPPGTEAGLAAMFEPDPPMVLVQDGVLAHRRVAFDHLAPALLRLTRAGR